jgi:hypothetical protein
MKGVVPLITQTEEYDEDLHLQPFSTRAIRYGFGEEEARDEADSKCRRVGQDVLGNSSTPVSEDSEVPKTPVSNDSCCERRRLFRVLIICFYSLTAVWTGPRIVAGTEAYSASPFLVVSS